MLVENEDAIGYASKVSKAKARKTCSVNVRRRLWEPATLNSAPCDATASRNLPELGSKVASLEPLLHEVHWVVVGQWSAQAHQGAGNFVATTWEVSLGLPAKSCAQVVAEASSGDYRDLGIYILLQATTDETGCNSSRPHNLRRDGVNFTRGHLWRRRHDCQVHGQDRGQSWNTGMSSQEW